MNTIIEKLTGFLFFLFFKQHNFIETKKNDGTYVQGMAHAWYKVNVKEKKVVQ